MVPLRPRTRTFSSLGETILTVHTIAMRCQGAARCHEGWHRDNSVTATHLDRREYSGVQVLGQCEVDRPLFAGCVLMHEGSIFDTQGASDPRSGSACAVWRVSDSSVPVSESRAADSVHVSESRAADDDCRASCVRPGENQVINLRSHDVIYIARGDASRGEIELRCAVTRVRCDVRV